MPYHWFYDTLPNGSPRPGFRAVLQARQLQILKWEHDNQSPKDWMDDLRKFHRWFFSELHDHGRANWVGNFRGCHADSELAGCVATLTSNGEVIRCFEPPATVQARMDSLTVEVRHTRRALRTIDPHSPSDRARAVYAIARLFHKFLDIHPFSDGNGHTGRFLAWLMAREAGIDLPAWTIEPRPLAGYPEYYLALREADQGDFTRMTEMLVLPASVAPWVTT